VTPKSSLFWPFAVLVSSTPVTLQIQAIRHARISADIVSEYFRHQASELPELPAQAHAAVEA
jgi:hypothetical protein